MKSDSFGYVDLAQWFEFLCVGLTWQVQGVMHFHMSISAWSSMQIYFYAATAAEK